MFTTEGEATREHLIEHNSKGPNVGPKVKLLTLRLLGRHIRCASRNCALLSDRGILGEFCQTEIKQLDDSLSVDDDIRGFDVPMDGSLLVSVQQSLSNLDRNVPHTISWKRSASDYFFKRLSLHILHCNEGLGRMRKSILDFVQFERRRDVGVGKGCSCLGLMNETIGLIL